jgi:hypothetical protein
MLMGELENFQDECVDVAEAMQQYGGSFIKALGTALQLADNSNRIRIKKAWPELWTQYLKQARMKKK